MIDDACGRIVPPGDIDALADRASELIALSADARTAMGAAGRAAMLEKYDRPKCVAEWLSIYDNLLASRGGA